MTAGSRGWLRAGLALLTVIQAVAGVWQYAAPRAFYGGVPTVSADPPFNAHLMTDVGGLGMALAVILAASALTLEPTLVRAALAGYLVYSVSHLAFHTTHLAGLSPAAAAGLLTGLAAEPLLAVALLLLAARAGRVSPRAPGPADRSSTPAGPGSRGRPS
jgi:hypothetical protein